ncbi:DUF2561 family protein [Mycobacterium sp. OTB74]|uniref:DUF2561 family protein n=1 Tax=Mycobacterium sp. OTB74 TaxID=1853452 RepID=UPI00247467C0|nr:DUF2561 family protein [Mycobacterium sp. OTB74]MDH6245976.1 heme/copper-type cytochrome/quinol oxidase subunit 4 [Mycobacterium sp. OTB74]
MPTQSESAFRSRVTGATPDQFDRILVGVCIGAWLAALGAGVAAVVALVDLGTRHPNGSDGSHTPWLLYAVIGVSLAVILGAIPLLLRARRAGQGPPRPLFGGSAEPPREETAGFGDTGRTSLRSFNDPVVRRYSASPATSMLGFPVAAVDRLWLRCTAGIVAAMGAATLFVFLATYMMADSHDQLSWILYGLAAVVTAAMVGIPWYCLRELHVVLDESAESARTA